MSNRPNTKRKAPPRPKPGSSPAASAGRPWWQNPIALVGGLVAIALIVAIAIGVTGGGDDENVATGVGAGTETKNAEILGAPLPPFSSPDAAVGLPVPQISGTTFAGDRVTVSNDGTAKLYGFFAHWCPHCQVEVPRTVDYLAANPLPEGVELIAISTSVRPTQGNYPPSEWFEREGWPTAVIVDSEDNALGTGFGLTAFPYWVVADAEGNVVSRVTGEISSEQFAEMIASITP